MELKVDTTDAQQPNMILIWRLCNGLLWHDNWPVLVDTDDNDDEDTDDNE